MNKCSVTKKSGSYLVGSQCASKMSCSCISDSIFPQIECRERLYRDKQMTKCRMAKKSGSYLVCSQCVSKMSCSCVSNSISTQIQ